jgi:hypothetical protein
MMTSTEGHPSPSAISNLISQNQAKTESTALPLEVVHKLQHQHGWRELRLHAITQDRNASELVDLESANFSLQTPRSHHQERIHLISGLPPRHSYLHPDFQNQLIRQSISEKSVVIQREWVLPVSLGEKWTLKKFCHVFDALPPRFKLEPQPGSQLNTEWVDSKRVLMGMLSTNGMGGDGTIVYYIMQEGDVKPRQNG